MERIFFMGCYALLGGMMGVLVDLTIIDCSSPSKSFKEPFLLMMLGILAGGAVIGGVFGYYADIPMCPKRITKYKCFNQECLDATGWNGDVPLEFNDPVDFQLMDKPLKTLANDFARIYDIRTLNNLDSTECGKPKCPFSRQPITILGPDFELERKIKLFVEEKKRAKNSEEKGSRWSPSLFFARIGSSANVERQMANNQEFRIVQ